MYLLLLEIMLFCCARADEDVAENISDVVVTESGRLTSQTVRSRRPHAGALPAARKRVSQCTNVYYNFNDNRLGEVNPRVASVLAGLAIPDPFATMGPILPKIVITDTEGEDSVVLIARPNRQMMNCLFPFYKTSKKELVFEANEELKLYDKSIPDSSQLQFSDTTTVHLIPRVIDWRRWIKLNCCVNTTAVEDVPDNFIADVDTPHEMSGEVTDVSFSAVAVPSTPTALAAPPTHVESKPIPRSCIKKTWRTMKTVSIWTPVKWFPLFWHQTYKKKIGIYFEYMINPFPMIVDADRPAPLKSTVGSQTTDWKMSVWPDSNIKRWLTKRKLEKAYSNLTEKRLYGRRARNSIHLLHIPHDNLKRVRHRKGGDKMIKTKLLTGSSRRYTLITSRSRVRRRSSRYVQRHTVLHSTSTSTYSTTESLQVTGTTAASAATQSTDETISPPSNITTATIDTSITTDTTTTTIDITSQPIRNIIHVKPTTLSIPDQGSFDSISPIEFTTANSSWFTTASTTPGITMTPPSQTNIIFYKPSLAPPTVTIAEPTLDVITEQLQATASDEPTMSSPYEGAVPKTSLPTEEQVGSTLMFRRKSKRKKRYSKKRKDSMQGRISLKSETYAMKWSERHEQSERPRSALANTLQIDQSTSTTHSMKMVSYSSNIYRRGISQAKIHNSKSSRECSKDDLSRVTLKNHSRESSKDSLARGSAKNRSRECSKDGLPRVNLKNRSRDCSKDGLPHINLKTRPLKNRSRGCSKDGLASVNLKTHSKESPKDCLPHINLKNRSKESSKDALPHVECI